MGFSAESDKVKPSVVGVVAGVIEEAMLSGFNRNEALAEEIIRDALTSLRSDSSDPAVQKVLDSGYEIVRERHEGNDYKLTMRVELGKNSEAKALILEVFEGVSGRSAVNSNKLDKFDSASLHLRIAFGHYAKDKDSIRAIIGPAIALFNNG
jgi:hypothetical protein